MNKWNELRDRLLLCITDTTRIRWEAYFARIVLGYMTELDNKEMNKSLTEAGY